MSSRHDPTPEREPEREPDVLNIVTAACDGDAQHHPNPDPAYWRKWLLVTGEPKLVW